MKKHYLLVATLMFALITTVACEDDPAKPDPVPPTSFGNLSERSHVLTNLEKAYNTRRIEKYDELLDDTFTFFLSPGDVGGSVPAQWDRATEVLCNTRLLDVNYSGDHRCTSVQLDLDLGDPITWVEFEPAVAPGETWYTTTVFYAFRFDVVPDTNYNSIPGSKAQFTVRNAGTDESPTWRLVEMRDLAENYVTTHTAGATEASTWGAVKSLYR